MKKTLFTVAALASIATFATTVSGPKYRIEGELGFPVKIKKGEPKKSAPKGYPTKIGDKYYIEGAKEVKGKVYKDGDESSPALEGKDPVIGKRIMNIFQKSTDLQLNFIPEWTHKVNDKIDLVFGPKISVGDKMLTQYNAEQDGSFESVHGLFASVGGEFNVDFALPKGEKIFIGLGLNLGVQGIIDFSNGLGKSEVLGSGHVANVDFLIGGKISERIKLALSLGYENTGIKTKYTGTTDNPVNALGLNSKSKYDISHSFRPGLTFGYIIK